jgi:hypothetical protein
MTGDPDYVGKALRNAKRGPAQHDKTGKPVGPAPDLHHGGLEAPAVSQPVAFH